MKTISVTITDTDGSQIFSNKYTYPSDRSENDLIYVIEHKIKCLNIPIDPEEEERWLKECGIGGHAI